MQIIPSNLRSGTCRGGPLAGKPLHHHEDRFYCFKRIGRDGAKNSLITYSMPDGGAADLPPDVKVGAYEFDGDGLWHWTREV